MTLATDAMDMILQSPEPFEWVEYRPYQGQPRKIRALVTRRPNEANPLGMAQSLIKSDMEVFVVNDPVEGVAAPTLGRDEMAILTHLYDAAPTPYSVAVIVAEDAGAFTFGVVK
jgi:hypothetical protein